MSISRKHICTRVNQAHWSGKSIITRHKQKTEANQTRRLANPPARLAFRQRKQRSKRQNNKPTQKTGPEPKQKRLSRNKRKRTPQHPNREPQGKCRDQRTLDTKTQPEQAVADLPEALWPPLYACRFPFGRRPLPFSGSHLRLPSGPAGIRTTTGSNNHFDRASQSTVSIDGCAFRSCSNQLKTTSAQPERGIEEAFRFRDGQCLRTPQRVKVSGSSLKDCLKGVNTSSQPQFYCNGWVLVFLCVCVFFVFVCLLLDMYRSIPVHFCCL